MSFLECSSALALFTSCQGFAWSMRWWSHSVQKWLGKSSNAVYGDRSLSCQEWQDTPAYNQWWFGCLRQRERRQRKGGGGGYSSWVNPEGPWSGLKNWNWKRSRNEEKLLETNVMNLPLRAKMGCRSLIWHLERPAAFLEWSFWKLLIAPGPWTEFLQI